MSLKDVIATQFEIKNTNSITDFLNIWSPSFQIKRNQHLIRYKETVNHIYFIEKGTCCVTYPDKKEDIVVGFGYPNTFLFSPSILHNKPAEQEVITIKNCSFTSIHKKHFFDFIESAPSYKSIWQKQLENLLVAQIDRQVDLLISSPEERLQRLLDRSPHVFQLIPKKYIASYLRMTPETLSRIQKP